MRHGPPDWAMRRAEPSDLAAAREARERGTLRVKWPDPGALKKWARKRAWPVTWFGFEEAFLAKMLEDEGSFALALADSGVELSLPRSEVALPPALLRDLDALYESPASWANLVGELREIRRAVEAGVVVSIGDATLRTWQGFYTWAHGRYHALEEGADSWIGDDRS